MLAMKLALLVLAVMCATPACAAGAEATFGKADCKVVNPYPQQGEKVRWSGACKDGYAHGPGSLDWLVRGMLPSHYEGNLTRGRMDDSNGYLRDAEGNQYEGAFVDGEQHGMGIEQRVDLTRYEGEWKHGRFDGKGKVVYADGSRYEGQWLGGRIHGAGKASYTGGKVVEGQFYYGVPAGQAPIDHVVSDKTYALSNELAPTGSLIPDKDILGSEVPYNKPWAGLSKKEQRLIRQRYGLLAEDDEPPYPLYGTENIMRAIATGQHQILALGILRMNVMVDSSGTPVSVTVFTSPDPVMTKVASFAVMKEKYKPALCAGTPCAMIFPFSLRMSVE